MPSLMFKWKTSQTVGSVYHTCFSSFRIASNAKKKHQPSTTINSVYSLYVHLICYHHQPPEVSLFQHVSTTHRQLKGGGCEHPGARHQRSVHGNHLSIHHVDSMDQGSLSTVHVPPWTLEKTRIPHPHKNKWKKNRKQKITNNISLHYRFPIFWLKDLSIFVQGTWRHGPSPGSQSDPPAAHGSPPWRRWPLPRALRSSGENANCWWWRAAANACPSRL